MVKKSVQHLTQEQLRLKKTALSNELLNSAARSLLPSECVHGASGSAPILHKSLIPIVHKYSSKCSSKT